jgi:hypothetical protein
MPASVWSIKQAPNFAVPALPATPEAIAPWSLPPKRDCSTASLPKPAATRLPLPPTSMASRPAKRPAFLPGTVPYQGHATVLFPEQFPQPRRKRGSDLWTTTSRSMRRSRGSAFGAGYAPKGILRGRLAIPIHDREGTLLAYCGRTVKNESPTLTFPNGFDTHSVIFGAHKVQAGKLYLVRDPLQVLTAYEAGGENVVAFLTTITAQQLEQLASLMDQKKVETVELF